MNFPLRVLVATNLERLPKRVRELVVSRIEKWSYLNCATVHLLPPSITSVESGAFRGYDVVISRPTDRLKLIPELFSGTDHQINIYSVSVGTSNLDNFREADKLSYRFKIEDTYPANNAIGVAHFNVMLASHLLYDVPANILNIVNGRFDNVGEQSGLENKVWLILGSGNQAAWLVNVAAAIGLQRVFIWNDRMDGKKFENCFKYVGGLVGRGLRIEGKKATIEYFKPDGTKTGTEFFGIDDEGLVEAGKQADIISTHMTLQAEEKNGRKATLEYVGAEFLSKLKNRPILINTGRGELLNEQAVVEALDAKVLRAVAVDVLSSQVEFKSTPEASPLWNRYLQSITDLKTPPSDLVITPHIAGSAESDLISMWTSLLENIEKNHVFVQKAPG